MAPREQDSNYNTAATARAQCSTLSIAERACAEIRTHIGDHIDHTLEPAERAEVDNHLDDCQDCRALRRQLEIVKNGLREMSGAAMPADAKLRLRQRLQS